MRILISTVVTNGWLRPKGVSFCLRSEERRVFYRATTYYPLNKIFQHHAHPPAAAATVTISSSSVITSNINSNKIYVIAGKGSANNVSAAVLTYDYDAECFQTLSNPRKTYVSPKEC